MKSLNTILLLVVSVVTCYNSNAQTTKPYFYDASFSPTTNEIAFVTGGDIWTVSSNGGEARLLVSHPAMETRPLYSPDGKMLAFHSTRSGNGDIYILDIGSGKLTRLTYDDANDEINNWSADGKYIYFTSSGKDIAGMRDIYRIKATGGTAMQVSEERYVAEFFAAPSPDGKTLALVARGFGAAQWWRNGRSHLDESEIWLLDETSKKYTQLTQRGAKQLWPMWSPDGKILYYVSDLNGEDNVWMQPINGTAKQLTNFKSGRVLFPSISKDGKQMVFERDFGIWKMDLTTNEVKALSITLKGAAASATPELQKMTQGFSDLAVSPDGKKIAFTAQGDLYVAGTKDGGDATRITNSLGMEGSPVWTKNSNSVIYVADRKDNENIYQYDFITGKETQLTSAKADDGALSLSPDGKKLAFVRNGKELVVLDLATKKETAVAKASLAFNPISSSGNYAWSPDSKHIAYAAFGAKALRNVYIVPANGGESKPISFLGNTFGGDVVWGKDGMSVLFVTQQRTENGQVAKIDLQPRIPVFREDQFRDLFSDPSTTTTKTKTDAAVDSLTATPAKKDIVYEGVRDRLSLLPLDVDVQGIDITKDGNTLIVVATIAGQTNIYTYSLDELSKETPVLKQLTSTPGFKSFVQLSNDGKEVYYIENGRINSINIDNKQSKNIFVTAEMMIDFNERKMEVFNQAWELEYKGFYDEKFHGADWVAIRSQYQPYIAGSQTPEEMRRILSLMVGELNASHTGIGANTNTASNLGKLGLRFDRQLYEQTGALKVTEVVANGPAALTGKINKGDLIRSIDGVQINGNVNIDALLENKVNRRVMLSINPGAGYSAVDVAVKPVNTNTEKGLLYKQWVQEKRDYVAKISNGKLGYVHMFDMGQSSLDQLHLDIDAYNQTKDGVVVDVRNNNGGFVNAYAIDVLSRKGYLNMQVRGLENAPGRVQLGQRALDAPTILVTNQHSLSDAEDFSEGYRALGLGKVVGEPTAGWIIFTTNITLFDGTVVRLPFIKITDSKGNNMELAPRPVDIPVTNALGANGDAQLDTAVKELLKQIESAKKK
jgi:Tol biopolymer transport system component/C-terminal processing protease CtpA/Prc